MRKMPRVLFLFCWMASSQLQPSLKLCAFSFGQGSPNCGHFGAVCIREVLKNGSAHQYSSLALIYPTAQL